MYKNSNSKVVRELSIENYKAHPARNRIAVLAVALTTILITVVFTVGISLAGTVYRSETASPGPGADGNFIYGTGRQLEEVKKLPQVDWAAFAARCSTSYLHNKEFSGLDVRLFAPDETHYEKNMIKLIAGKYPEAANEILLSDSMSEKLALSQKVGVIYPLTVVVRKQGEDVEKVIPMKVCGYYKNPLLNVSGIYEEIYTDKSFIATYNPEIPQGYDHIYIKMNDLNFLSLEHDKEEKLEEVNRLAGGNGIQYKMSSMSFILLLPVVLVILVVMMCGYFFIYNVFYLSIANDIRFFGELKTIGMTSRQLRKMLLLQMNRIAFTGIIIGFFIGYIMGVAASNLILPAFASGIAGYYQTLGITKVILPTAFFSWLTTYISTMKPFRLVGCISPVEASRYWNKKKKGVFSILSLALSGILFLTVYTVTAGYDVEYMVERYNQADFKIYHKGTLWALDEPYQPVSSALVQEIKSLPEINNLNIYYSARTKPDVININNDKKIYLASKGEISKKGGLAQDMSSYNACMEEDSGDRFKVNERGNYKVNIMGVPAASLLKERKYIRVLEGKLDEKKFAAGIYLIYQRSSKINRGLEKDQQYQVHAGDEVTVSFYDDAAGAYAERQFFIMAVINKDDRFGTGNIADGNMIIEEEVFKGIYSDYENLVGRIQFDLKGNDPSEIQKTVKNIVERDGNLQLQLKSRYDSFVHFTERKNMIGILGAFLAVTVGLIGISNVANTIITGILARKIEFAAMQSIGMTRRQMRINIFWECSGYVCTAAALAVIAGIPLTAAIANMTSFTGFSLFSFLQALCLLVVLSIILCVFISGILTYVLNRKTIVERLREAENE